MPGPTPPRVPLSEEERQVFHTMIRAHKTPQHLSFRAQIILLLAEGLPAPDVARRLGTTRTTVRRWRRPWLNAEPDALAGEKMADLTALYVQAPALGEAGERVLSTDEMTGIQALERTHPPRLMAPGQAERREFEYIRRGTLTLIANFDIAQGTVVAPSLGPTRTEEDFVTHITHTVASDDEAIRWHFVLDNLN